MPRRFACRWFAAIATLVWLQSAGATDVLAQSGNLVVNPAFARDRPVPGWIGDHRDAWVREHPVYRSTCGNVEVMKEIRFLNRVIASDEYLLSLTTASDPNNPATDHLATAARQSAASLHRDIVTVDALVAELRLLPSCDAGKPEKAAPVRTIPAQPMPATTPAATPSPPRLVAEPGPAVQQATLPPAPPARSEADQPVDPVLADRLVIRFDSRIAALTPSGIRTFDEAVIALRNGKKLRLAIEGCDAGANFSDGSPCARRLLTLKQLLAENGLRDTRRLLAETR